MEIFVELELEIIQHKSALQTMFKIGVSKTSRVLLLVLLLQHSLGRLSGVFRISRIHERMNKFPFLCFPVVRYVHLKIHLKTAVEINFI